ncbi:MULTISPECIES: helix-turn-helix domain-containing protein [Colwellia]|jgi:excisionase family DNA binding protein|uniref:helix-turn-helix domain-containing protein n=1 Tax=Colwellia TaxID=28228 RepID=UPI0009BE0F1E|nr:MULTISPECIES: helix-turn-helix domain-containing protein [Colwellia]ARD44766.1 excisionase [Colwellia sp. PAMC 21821]|tara:strand:- start:5470 stop:5676 length:207 start_codon:yes stop_codon:yes gene_type:complete
MNQNLLTPTQAADILGVTIGTLAVWRCTARYPLPFVKIGRRVKYRLSDINNFIEQGLNNLLETDSRYA